MKKLISIIALLLALIMSLTAVADTLLIMPSPSALPFKDVSESAWYYADVKSAYESGLINGKGSTDTYKPDDNMTYAEAAKLAACMHQSYTEGKVTLENGSPWYQTFVDYCKEKGIIKKDYDYSANATRAGYMEIFVNALPAEALKQINIIPDNYIPDVSSSAEFAPAVYKFYEAGIVAGVDADNNCSPRSNIKRSEVATILARMMNEERRVSVGFPKEKENELTFGLFADVHNVKADFENVINTIFALSDDGSELDGLALVGDVAYLSTNSSIPSASTYSMIKSNAKFTRMLDANRVAYAMGNHEFPLHATDKEKCDLSKQVFETEMGFAPERDLVIDGYHFIAAGPDTYENKLNAAQENYIIETVTKALDDGTDKPVFLLIHQPIDNTLFGTTGADKYSTRLEEFLKAEPRLIVFSAHMHYPLSDPQSIYQVPGGATFVYTSSIMGGNGAKPPYVTERHREWPSQAMMIKLDTETNVVTLKRFYASSGKPVYLEGGDWTLDIPAMIAESGKKNPNTTEVYKYTYDRASLSKPADFPDGTTVSVSDITETSAKVSVPLPTPGAEGEDSYVAYFKMDAVNKKTGETLFNKRVLTDYFLRTKGDSFEYTLLDLPSESDIKLTLTPVTPWKVEGEAITVEFSTLAPKFKAVKLNEENTVRYNVYESRLMGTYTKYTDFLHYAAGTTGSSRYIVDITKPAKYRVFFEGSATGSCELELTIAKADVEYSEKSDGTEKVTITNEVDLLNDVVLVNTGSTNTMKEMIVADVEFEEAGSYIIRFKKKRTPYTVGMKGIRLVEIAE